MKMCEDEAKMKQMEQWEADHEDDQEKMCRYVYCYIMYLTVHLSSL